MKFKRLMAVLISMALIVGMIPTLVFADESQPEPAETGAAQTTESKETKETKDSKETKEKKPEETKDSEPSKPEVKETEETKAIEETTSAEPSESKGTEPSESNTEISETEESKESNAVKGKMPKETQSVGKKNAQINISGETKLSTLVADGFVAGDDIRLSADAVLVIDTDLVVGRIDVGSGDLTIKGDHTLTVTNCIKATPKTLKIESGTVVVKNIDSSEETGIIANKLYISGGKLDFCPDSTLDSGVYGVFVKEEFKITGGSLSIDVTSKNMAYGLKASDKAIISGGTITVNTKSGTGFSIGIYANDLKVSDGNIKITADSTSSGSDGIDAVILDVSGGTINATAKSSEAGTGANGIFSNMYGSEWSISGGNITAQANNAGSSRSAGMHFSVPGAAFSITGGTVNASGRDNGIYVSGDSSTTFTIDGKAKVTAVGKEQNGIFTSAPLSINGSAVVTAQGKDSSLDSTVAIYAKRGLSIADTLMVSTPANWAFVDSDNRVIKDADTNQPAVKVVIEPKAKAIANVYCYEENTNAKITDGSVYVFKNSDSKCYAGTENIQISVIKGDSFTLTAGVESGDYKFVAWYKDGKGPHQGGTFISSDPTISCSIDDDTWYYAAFSLPKQEIKSLTFTSDKGPSVNKAIEDCVPTVSVAETGVTVTGRSWVDMSGNHLPAGHVFSVGENVQLLVDYSVDAAYELVSGIEEKTTFNGVKPTTHDVSDTKIFIKYTVGYDITGTETEVTGISDMTYTGSAITQTPVVKFGGTELTEGTDYTISYENNTNAGIATVKITGIGSYTGVKTVTFEILKAENTLAVKPKTATVKYKKLKKKNQTLSIFKVLTFTSGGQGTKSYAKVSGNKKITINKTTGKVTVKKKLKKGTYKVKIKVKAAGNTNYNESSWKTVTIRVKVKK